MKRFLSILGMAIMLSSCNDVISKKPNIETAKEDIAQIKEKYKDEYSAEDFEALSDKLAGKVLGGVFAKGENAIKEGITFDKTYKEYLDEIKVAREKKEKILAELKGAVSVEVLEHSKVQGTGLMADYDVKMPVKIKVKNTSKNKIQGITGRIELVDMFDKKVENLGFELTSGLNIGEEKTDTYYYDIGFGDLKDMEETAFSKLKFVWVPEKIVFQDGSYIPKDEK